jgi:hypothetical protein
MKLYREPFAKTEAGRSRRWTRRVAIARKAAFLSAR